MSNRSSVIRTEPPAPPLRVICNSSEVEELTSRKKIVIIGFFKDYESNLAKTFIKMETIFEHFIFGLCNNIHAFNVYVKYDSAVMFKPPHETQIIFDSEISESKLINAINLYSLPLFIEYNMNTLKALPNCGIKTRLLFFISKADRHMELFINPLHDLAREYRTKILFQIIDKNAKDVDFWFKYLNVPRSVKKPEMWIIKLQPDHKHIKYKPETNILLPAIVRDFIEKYFNDELEEFMHCEKVPDDWDKDPVKILVCDNFNEVAFDKTKNVFVFFYTPTCSKCNNFEKKIEKLGTMFEDDNDVIIAKINSVANRSLDMGLKTVPEGKLFRKGDNKIIDYNMGHFDINDCVKFIQTDGESKKDITKLKEQKKKKNKLEDEEDPDKKVKNNGKTAKQGKIKKGKKQK